MYIYIHTHIYIYIMIYQDIFDEKQIPNTPNTNLFDETNHVNPKDFTVPSESESYKS